MWRLLDRYLGRGAYPILRAWLAPERARAQDAYPAAVLGALCTHPRWLDAGCGHNLFEPRFAKQEALALERARLIVGCDATVRSLRSHPTLKRLAACELKRLPFEDGSFNLVTLHWVVEHLPDPQAVFSEIRRVLTPGGLVILRTPNAASYYVGLARFGMRLLPSALVDRLIRHMQHREPDDVFPTFYRANTRCALSSVAREAGLVDEKIVFYADQPLLYFIAPLAAVELGLTRLGMSWLGWHELFADTLLAVLRRPAAAPEGKARREGGDNRKLEGARR